MNNPPILQFSADGNGLRVNLQKLLAHKLAVQGNSGSGKSWLLRTLMEGTHGAVQHLIVDPEGEFRTLREIYDDYVILAATGGDLDVVPEQAERPIRELVIAGASIVLDLSDFGEVERDAVCAAAVRAVMSLEREHWRHLLVIVDEAQTLAPESGRGGAALGALTDLAMRGRKRGFGLVVATQRLALLNKSLLAMCSNRLVGLTTLGNDMKRAAEELGFDTAERQTLKTLKPGQWYAFGPAISQDVTLVQSAPVRSTHPEPGQLVAPTPPASEALARVIEELRALPTETEPSMGAEKPSMVGASEAEVQRRIRAAVEQAVERETEPLHGKLGYLEHVLKEIARLVESGLRDLGEMPAETAQAHVEGIDITPKPVEKLPENRHEPRSPVDLVPVDFGLPAPQRRILRALAEMEALGVYRLDRRTAAVLSQQSPKSSAYGAHVAKLSVDGLVTYPSDGLLALTEAGRELAPRPDRPLTLAELHGRWFGYLDQYEASLLRPLIDHHPWPLRREQLAEVSGRSLSSSAFGAAVASLEKLGLVSYPSKGSVKATELLFPKGLEPLGLQKEQK